MDRASPGVVGQKSGQLRPVVYAFAWAFERPLRPDNCPRFAGHAKRVIG